MKLVEASAVTKLQTQRERAERLQRFALSNTTKTLKTQD